MPKGGTSSEHKHDAIRLSAHVTFFDNDHGAFWQVMCERVLPGATARRDRSGEATHVLMVRRNDPNEILADARRLATVERFIDKTYIIPPGEIMSVTVYDERLRYRLVPWTGHIQTLARRVRLGIHEFYKRARRARS